MEALACKQPCQSSVEFDRVRSIRSSTWSSSLLTMYVGDMVAISRRPNLPPTSNVRSERCLSAWSFILCCALWRFPLRTANMQFLSRIRSSTVGREKSPGTCVTCSGGGCPYITWKGIILRELWKLVLYQNSAKDNQLGHFFRHYPVIQRKYVSKHRFTTSVCPSLCGWYADE